MANKNILRNLRISNETDNLLDELSEHLEIRKTDLARMLLNKTLNQIKHDSIKAGGYENLEFMFLKK